MNELAVLLNKEIENTVAYRLLSDYGKRIYFPSKGIVAQAGEAKAKAHLYDATIGMACYQKKPIVLPQIKAFITGLTEEEFVSYAPTPGIPQLRVLWKEEIYRKNPELGKAPISLPIIVPGLTSGIAQLSDLFLQKGLNIVVPDMFWGNYRLIFESRQEANVILYSFFNEDGTLNIADFKEKLIASAQNKQIKTILNFPNNPTGYSPSIDEADSLQALFLELANDGFELLIITDDAYFGLFFEEDTYKQSIFAKIANLHPNILAVKVDGTTKEHFTWGFRNGFVTFGCKNFTEIQYNSLVEKLSGSLRASVSNSSRTSQSILLKALSDPTYEAERQKYDDQLKDRYLLVKEVLANRTNGKKLKELPCNSGYFMSFEVDGDAEALRKLLLDEDGIGTISIQGKFLRIAFSAVDKEYIVDLYKKVLDAADRL